MNLKEFFKGKKNDTKSNKDAIRQLEDTRDLLGKKSEHLEKLITDEIAIARKHGMRNKKMALKALARKRGYEKQLQRIDNTLIIIENQIQSVEDAGMNLEVFKTLQSTSKALKASHNNMKIDDVHKIMDDVAEQRDIAQEISDVISDPGAFGMDYDNDELLQELEDLTAEQMENDLLDVNDLPNVPTKDIPIPSTSEPVADSSARDLHELMQWAE